MPYRAGLSRRPDDQGSGEDERHVGLECLTWTGRKKLRQPFVPESKNHLNKRNLVGYRMQGDGTVMVSARNEISLTAERRDPNPG